MTWWPDFDLPRIRLGEVVLSCLFLCATLGFGVMTYDPDFQRWWVLGLMACIGSLMFPVKLSVSPPVFWAVGFVLYAALSLLWSADPAEGFDDLICLSIVLVLFVGAQQVDLEPYIRRLVPLSALIACGLLWYLPQRFGGFGNDTFIAEFLLIALSFCLKGKARWVAVVVVLTLALGVESNTRRLIAILAMSYGLVWLWRRGHRYAAVFLPVAGLNAVFLLGLSDPGVIWSSVTSRAEIHINTALMILESPLIGHGAGSFEYVYPRFQEAHMKLFPGMGTIMSTGTMYVNAAHNDYLQVFAEYGAVGLVLAGGFLWSIRKSVAWPTVAVIAVLALVGFPLQNPATIVLALIAVSPPRRAVALTAPSRLPAFALSVGLLWVTSLSLHAESLMTATRAAMGTNPLGALVANLKAYETWPYARGPRNQMMLTVTSVLRNTPHVVTPDSADNVYRIARSAGPDAPGLLLARLEYLINARRNKDEANEIMHRMYEHTPRQLRIALRHMEN